MKTYLINSIKQVSVNSQSWDTISTLKAQEWIVYNEDISQVEKFLFIDDKKLLVSVNGKSSYSKWKYIKVNSSLIIDDEINKYLLKIVVCNKDIIVLNVDSTNDYSFLINSKSFIFQNPTYEDIQWYLIRNCGVDILSEQQRNQFAEKKRLENEKKKKEQEEREQEREQEQKELLKCFGIVAGMVFIGLVVVFAFGKYNVYKKYHPTILITEERNKEAVDLGLSVKWASCNVGANSPEEYGNYYGWGDITGQHIAKGSDNWFFLDYQFPPRSTSDTISNSIVNTKYDMAKANWGNGWRLPTVEEIGELISNCSISEITTNGKRCYKITGINGQCIILPRAGLRINDSEYYAKGEDLYIWSGNLSYIIQDSDEHRQLAFALEISDSTRNGSRIPGIKIKLEHLYRWDGISVRAVKDK